MDVFGLLKEDHLRLKMECEDAYLYPILAGAVTTEALVLEANVAHKLTKTLLAELDAEPKDTLAWSAKVKFMREILALHVRHEEWELFPKARRLISNEDAESIAADIEAYRTEALLLQMG